MKKFSSFFLIRLNRFEFLIPLPFAIREIPSKIFVLPQPLSPNKIFNLWSNEVLKLLKTAAKIILILDENLAA